MLCQVAANATSTAAAGGGWRLPTNCWQRRRAYLASASRKGLAAPMGCVRKLIRLRIMRLNKEALSASHLLIFLSLWTLSVRLCGLMFQSMSADKFTYLNHSLSNICEVFISAHCFSIKLVFTPGSPSNYPTFT